MAFHSSFIIQHSSFLSFHPIKIAARRGRKIIVPTVAAPIEAIRTAALPMSSELPKCGSLSPVMALAIDSSALLSISAVITPAMHRARGTIPKFDLEDESGDNHGGGDEEVDEETTLPAHAFLHAAESVRNLSAQERFGEGQIVRHGKMMNDE